MAVLTLGSGVAPVKGAREFDPIGGWGTYVYYDSNTLWVDNVVATDEIIEFTGGAGVTFSDSVYFTGLSEDNSATYVVSIDPTDGSITYTALTDLVEYGTDNQIPVMNAAGTGFEYSPYLTYASSSFLVSNANGDYSFINADSMGIYSDSASRYVTYIDPFTTDGGNDFDAYIFNTVAAFSNPLSELMSVRTANTHIFTIYGDGHMENTTYGSGSFTGTPAYALTVDANGNIIESAYSSLSYGTEDQIPVTNAAGNNFDYSAGFTFNGTTYTLLLGDPSVSNTIIQAASGSVANPTGVDLEIYGGAPYDAAGEDAGGVIIRGGNARLGDGSSSPGPVYIYSGSASASSLSIPLYIGFPGYIGTATSIQPSGDEANISLAIRPKGTSNLTLGSSNTSYIWNYATAQISWYSPRTQFVGQDGTVKGATGNATQGDGYSITIQGGDVEGTETNGIGGTVYIKGGIGKGTGEGGEIYIQAGDGTGSVGSGGGDVIIKGGDANDSDVTTSYGAIHLVPGDPRTSSWHGMIYLGHATLNPSNLTHITIQEAGPNADMSLYIYQKGTGNITLGSSNGTNANIYGTTLVNLFSPEIRMGRSGTTTTTITTPNVAEGSTAYSMLIQPYHAYSTDNEAGGDLTLKGGQAAGTGNSGDVYVTALAATGTAGSDGGSVEIRAGNANSGDATSSRGYIYLIPGISQNGTQGTIYLGDTGYTGSQVYLEVEASGSTNVSLYIRPHGTGNLNLGLSTTAATNIYGTGGINLYTDVLSFPEAEDSVIRGGYGQNGVYNGYDLTLQGGYAYQAGGTGNGGAIIIEGGESYSSGTGGQAIVRGGPADVSGGGDGGDVLIYGGNPDGAGTRGNVYIGDGSSNAYLPARSAETNVVYYDTTTGKLSYATNDAHAAYTGALTDGAPTDAQLDSATSTTPAAVGAGWKAIVTDTDGTALSYLIVSDGTNWHYVALAVAT